MPDLKIRWDIFIHSTITHEQSNPGMPSLLTRLLDAGQVSLITAIVKHQIGN